jgi:hypothetical protein
MDSPELGHCELEAVASEILEATGTTAPVDAFALAAACGFELRLGGVPEAQIGRSTICVNPRMRQARQHMRIAHELGHFALERHGLPDSERGASYVGGALLLPRREMMRDISRTAWSLDAIRELHPNASNTAIALRITQLREAVMTIIDPKGHKRPWRQMSHALRGDERLRKLSDWERDLAACAYAEGREIRGDELCFAVPLLDDVGSDDRVAVVCDA